MIEINEQEFVSEIMQKEQIILVDFYTQWCIPCKALTPVLESLEDEFKNKFKILKINIDENINIATEYNVRSVPTLIFFKDGSEIERYVGSKTKSALKSIFEKIGG